MCKQGIFSLCRSRTSASEGLELGKGRGWQASCVLYRKAPFEEWPGGHQFMQNAQAYSFSHLWVQQIHQVPVPALCFIRR